MRRVIAVLRWAAWRRHRVFQPHRRLLSGRSKQYSFSLALVFVILLHLKEMVDRGVPLHCGIIERGCHAIGTLEDCEKAFTTFEE